MGLNDRKLFRPVRDMVAFLSSREARRDAEIVAPYFDAAFYGKANPDVAASGQDPCLHYLKYGWREGRDPSPSFSTEGYLAAHPDVALSGINPLVHFALETGAPGPAPDPETAPEPDPAVELVAGHMDAVYYARTYPDFEKTGLDAATHYCRIGWRAGHDPAPDFSTSYYLTTNPDVRDSGLNPFWHFLTAGREEGRLPSHPGGWRHSVLTRQKPFEEACADWQSTEAEPVLMAPADIRAALAGHKAARRLMISVGHDDYRATPGGVQLCIETEEQQAAAAGHDYLNIHPWQPLPKLAAVGADPVLWLVFNGKTLGAARCSAIAAGVKGIYTGPAALRLVLHHLAGHAPERLAALAADLGLRAALFWIHDYFSLCTSYALQRNNIAPCAAPAPSSNACGVCLYGAARRVQLPRLAALFGALDIHVVSPSEVALGFWSDRTSLRTKRRSVVPHVCLTRKPRAKRDGVRPDTDGAVFAFVGTRVPHKGWPVFLELQKRLSSDPGCRFLYFGASDPGVDGIDFVPTHVRAGDPEAVARALAEHGVDLVLHWASWPETFSFSTFEALMGGAFVITNRGSGNVAAAVQRHRRGVVLADTAALYDWAKAGTWREVAAAARGARAKARFEARFSAVSFDALEEPALT